MTPEVSYLVGTLKQAKVENKNDLIQAWKSNSQ